MSNADDRSGLILLIYKNFVLTVIAVLLALVLVKLSEPVQVFPTRGDLAELRTITDVSQRSERRAQLVADMPVVWVEGGDIEVSGGSIEISGGNVTVDGEVSIWR